MFPFPLFPTTAALPVAPHGAPDWCELCPLSSTRQWTAERREQTFWFFWQCIAGWGVRLLLPAHI